jgi:hypothetical protein
MSDQAAELARLERENKRLQTENAALHRFCAQLSEIIDRLTAEKRRKA